MRKDAFILGVDVGTSSTKAVVFDEEGNAHWEAKASYPVQRPHTGWVEQKAEWWWEAFCKAVGEVLSQVRIVGKKIAAIGVTHQRITIVPVNRSMEPIRNAILWNDMRCGAQAEWATKEVGKERIYTRTGNFPSIWSVYKAMWLRDNEPGVYKRTYKLLLVQDYILYKLTGKLVTSSSSAIQTGCLDVASPTRWAKDILGLLGIPSHLWSEKILPGGVQVGGVKREAALLTGLQEGTPVIITAGDQPCGTLGVGANEEGTLAINGGTSCSLEVCVQELKLDPHLRYFIEISPTGDYLLEDSIWSGGSALMTWFKNNFAGQLHLEADNSEDVWQRIYDLVTQVPAGNKGLMLIPYFSGAASPYWDLRARGVLFGFLLDHGTSHLARAIVEGLAMETRRKIEFMEEGSGSSIRSVRMYGGSAKSAIWNQVFADILGIEVVRLKTSEATALGAAMCAAKGCGIYATFSEATQAMVHVRDVFVPDFAKKKLYDRLYNEVYSKFYDRVEDLIQTASRIVENEV